MKSARQLSFELILKVTGEHSYSNLAVNAALREHPLSEQDKSLLTMLVYGVLERKLTLDYNLELYLKQPLKKLHPKAYTALLLGSYQILFADKIPDRAAINESVNLVKQNGASFSSGLVNAVLRKVSANGLCLPPEEEELQYLSVRYSFPIPTIRLWLNAYGKENTLHILQSSLGAPPLYVRVNTTKITAEALVEKMNEEGAQATPVENVPNALLISGVPGVEHMKAFEEGLFHVQDLASQQCCARVNPAPGETVFDLCAAPGGKSFTMAERMQGEGQVHAFDLYEHRVSLIQSGASRLGLSNVTASLGDASVFQEHIGLADRVLCDVPCSGLGIVRRKPEIRYKDLSLVDNLPPLQYDILNNASRYVKPCGWLIYSTCSLNPKENEDVVNRFLQVHPEYEKVSTETLFPDANGSDGFFITVLKKEA